MSREAHVRFCERRRVRLPPPTLLLLEASHLLVEGGATEIVAATDVGTAPMAAAFARCGYVVVDQLIVHV